MAPRTTPKTRMVSFNLIRACSAYMNSFYCCCACPHTSLAYAFQYVGVSTQQRRPRIITTKFHWLQSTACTCTVLYRVLYTIQYHYVRILPVHSSMDITRYCTVELYSTVYTCARGSAVCTHMHCKMYANTSAIQYSCAGSVES